MKDLAREKDQAEKELKERDSNVARCKEQVSQYKTVTAALNRDAQIKGQVVEHVRRLVKGQNDDER